MRLNLLDLQFFVHGYFYASFITVNTLVSKLSSQ